MVNTIDATKPADGIPASKADLRNNLATAKSEIESLHGDLAGIFGSLSASRRHRQS